MIQAFLPFHPKFGPCAPRAKTAAPRSVSSGLPLVEIAALCSGIAALTAIGLIAAAQLQSGFQPLMVLMAYLLG